jgi:lipoprotein-releasing system permease protein
MLPISARIGLRYSQAKQGNSFVAFINFFSVLGLCLGMTALIVVLSIMNGLEAQLKSRVLGVVPHVVVDPNVSFADLSNIPSVLAVSKYTETQGLIQAPGELAGVLVQGIEPDIMSRYSSLQGNIVAGELQALSTGSYNVVIGAALAQKLDVRVGDSIRLMIPAVTRFTPLGQIPLQRRVNVVGIFMLQSTADTQMVFMQINDVLKLTRQQHAQQRLFLDDAFRFEQALSWINSGSVVSTWRARQGPLFDAVKMEKNMMALLLMLVVAVAAFNIVSALVMVVTEKRGDIAILQTQGLAKRHILFIFIANGLFNSLKGTLLGVGLGLLTMYTLNPLLMALNIPLALAVNGEPIPFLVDPLQISLVVLSAIILCLLASLPAAFQAMQVAPAAHLRTE